MCSQLPTLTPPISQPLRSITLPDSPTSNSLTFTAVSGPEITDEILQQCSELFSNNYGVWGERPIDIKAPKIGNRLKMSAGKLRKQLLSSPEATTLVVCHKHDATDDRQHLLGHAFATAWNYEGGRVGWVTQLVVSLAARKRYIATTLLQMLKSCEPFHEITAIGLVSSHPSACHALAKYTSSSIRSIDLDFCRQNVPAIIDAAPVEYVEAMKVHGSLFDAECKTGAICSVFTGFYVDHTEPLNALVVYESDGKWVLGELLEGHEFLVILPVRESTSPTHAVTLVPGRSKRRSKSLVKDKDFKCSLTMGCPR